MGRLPDNYLGPKARVSMLKADYPADTSAIRTSITLTEHQGKVAVLVKADILIKKHNDVLEVIASGHAFTADPWEEKDIEKAETVAVGRALVHAGYPETTVDEVVEVVHAPAPVEAKPAGLGKAAPKAEKPAVAASKPTAGKPPAGLGKAAPPKPAPAPEPEASEEDDAPVTEVEDPFNETDDLPTPEPEVIVAEPPKAATPTKMTKEELMKKYSKGS